MKNPSELLRSVENLHRERNIPKEVIFSSIEKAVRLAILKRYDDDEDVQVTINRDTGAIEATKGDARLDVEDLGRIPAMSGRNVMFQSFKEEESNSLFDMYSAQKGDLVHGTIQRFDGGAAIVGLGKTEAILPRSEQIPGETHHIGERIKAIILDVKKTGHRVRIILSRTHPVFVRRLFEEEIPEIQDQTISIRAVAREAGYRSKVAVSSIDMKVDCVGACVGVRGSRIKNVVDELGGERIDIVRWNDSLQVLILNALQPASIEEVMLYPRLGRAIVLVQEDQLSLAIGRRGQNVRLASKLVGWDIEIMTHDELAEGIERAETWFRELPGVSDEQIEAFIEEGFLSYDDITFVEPADLADLAGITEEEAETIIAAAEEHAETVAVEPKRGRSDDESRGRGPVSAAARLFSDDVSGQATETRPTVESVFGPEPPAEEEADGEEAPPEISGDEQPAEGLEESLPAGEEEEAEGAGEEPADLEETEAPEGYPEEMADADQEAGEGELEYRHEASGQEEDAEAGEKHEEDEDVEGRKDGTPG